MTTPEITNMTRTCQPPVFSAAGLVSACEYAWSAIRMRHPEVPAAVLIVASGSPAKPSGAMKWGHFADLRWQHGDTQLPEVLVSGEGLQRPAAEVFVTLLHEATHGLARVRGIEDTSRQGRWHNKKFAALAAELGLSASKDDKLGYSPCTLTDQAAADYADDITRLEHRLGAFRHPEIPGERKKRTNQNNGVSCECVCPRKIRLSVTAFDDGPIVCAVCESAFLPEGVDRDTYQHPTFGQPCQHGHDQADGQPADDDPEDPMVFYDPTGERYGIPTFPFKMAPAGLATRRQLRAEGKRPSRGQTVAAQLMWRKGKRVAYLYDIETATDLGTPTATQLAALGKAMLARRTCPICHQLRDYYIPRRTGACLDCGSGGLA
jgi:hypothetical protein